LIIKIIKLAGGAICGYDSKSVHFINKLGQGVYEMDMLSDIPKKGVRSTKQNAYYWAILEYLVREVDGSYDREFFHTSFKMAYFGHQEFNGLTASVGSTTKLSTSEMEGYLQMIRDWAWNKLELVLPKPNEFGL